MSSPLPLFKDERTRKIPKTRLEPLKLWFSNKKSDNKISTNNSDGDNKISTNNSDGDNKISTNNSSDDDNNGSYKIIYDTVYVDPLKDLFKSVKITDGFFRGRIFIADRFKLHEIYNSEKAASLYTDVPKKKIREPKTEHTDLPGTNENEMQHSADSVETHLPGTNEKQMQMSSADFVVETDLPGTKGKEMQNSPDSIETETDLPGINADSVETDLPGTNEKEMQNSADSGETDLQLMGPNVAIDIDNEFRLIIHPESDQADAESEYDDLAKSRYLMGRQPLIPNDEGEFFTVIPRDKPYDPRRQDNLFEFSFDTAYGLLKLNCFGFIHSKAVYLDVKWIKEDGDIVTDMYVCGRLTVVSDEYQETESVLFDTPPNKAIHAPLGDIKLLRRVVAVPYDSEFKVEADLCCAYSIDDDSPFVQIVDAFTIFPNHYWDDAYESTFMPEDRHNRNPLRLQPLIYESKKSIPGYGGCLEVKAYVDIK